MKFIITQTKSTPTPVLAQAPAPLASPKFQITLLIDLHTQTSQHKAGETIEVDEALYDWLQASYGELRAAEARALKQAELEAGL
jgi:hypothetical protein